jgi:hypothetical protein
VATRGPVAAGRRKAPHKRRFRAAILRARGGLRALDVSECEGVLRDAAILAAVAANGGSLLALRACEWAPDPGVMYPEDGAQPLDTLLALQRAAPALRSFVADARCVVPAQLPQLCAALRNEAPFELLRVPRLHVGVQDAASADEVLAAIAAAAAYAPLTGLRVYGGDAGVTPLGQRAVLDALVDAALLRRLSSVRLVGCGLTVASAPGLARLLAGTALTELELSNFDDHEEAAAPPEMRFFDASLASLLGGALRANTTLTCLELKNMGLWRDLDAAEALLGALRGHASLRELDVRGNAIADGIADERAGAALAALLAANAPALRSLSFMECDARVECLEAVFQALAYNTHLHTLRTSSRMRRAALEALVLDVLLPPLRTNLALRKLRLGDRHSDVCMGAEDFIAKRAKTMGAS